MAHVRTPRSSWVGAASRALAVGGPDAVRVETLAASLGVSKGGFYWHFTNRQALLDEVLDTWEKAMVDDVIDRIDGQPADPRDKLMHLVDLAASADIAVELAVRDWSRRDTQVAERLRLVDNRRMDYMRSLFGGISPDPDDVEARCMLAFSLWIANPFIAAQHGDRTRPQVMQLAMERLLTPSS